MTRQRIREIIFEADSRAGKLYDIALLLTVAASVLVVMLDSVAGIRAAHGRLLSVLEWFFTLAFSVDYVVRLWCVDRPARYGFSFFGIVDLVSILPTYVGVFVPGSHYLAVIRFLRVLRVFRVLKLSTYEGELALLARALRASHRRITVFLLSILTLVMILGTLMYMVEGQTNDGFTSIPVAIYWAIVTLTTVGYGDISPHTGLGQAIAAVVMILGYSIIIVPTGIIASSVAAAERQRSPGRACPACNRPGHDPDAAFCKHCGAALPPG